MKILALESSALAASAAILEDEIITAEYTTCFKKTHSETLLPMTDEIVRMTGTDLKTLDAVAVSAGPGSFTGLRIGAAQAKGLAFSLNKPLIGVPTLHAMAYGLYGSQYIVCPIMDARRSQVYTGLFEFRDGKMIVLMDSAALSVEELAHEAKQWSEKLGKKLFFLGDGVPVYREAIKALFDEEVFFAPASLRCQKASHVAVLAAEYYREGKISDAMSFLPVYLRKSQAEREREAAGLSTEPAEI